MEKSILNTSPDATLAEGWNHNKMYSRLKEARRQRGGEKRGSGKKCIYYCFNNADGIIAPASDVKLNVAEKISVNLKEKERIRISIRSLVSVMNFDDFDDAGLNVILATDIPELFADMVETMRIEVPNFDLVEIPPSDKSIPNWQYIGRWLN